MANEGGGKFRKQRQHYRKPYESQKTLFNRVTDAVRGIWTQSWVSKLLPSNVADKTLSTEPAQPDEALPGPSTSASCNVSGQHQLRSSLNSNFPASFKNDATFVQPFGSVPPRQTLPETSAQVVKQIKRRIAIDGRSVAEAHADAPGCLTTNGRGHAASSSQRQTKLTETADNQSEASEESMSTSGCSSLVPHVDKREYQKEVLQLNPSALQKLSEEFRRNVTPLQTDSGMRRPMPSFANRNQRVNPEDDSESGSARTSLWSEPIDVAGSSKPQTPACGKRPKFQASLLGSSLWAEKSVLSDSANNSPNSTFYRGATTFGGASAYSKLKLHQNTPYSSSLSARRQIRVKSAKSATSDVDIMSATAKRILHSLEKMSTPVLDAKKIPNDPSMRIGTKSGLLPNYGKIPAVKPPPRILTSTPMVGPPVGRLLTPAPVSTFKVHFNPEVESKTRDIVKVTETETATTSAGSYTGKIDKATTAAGGGKMRSVRSERHYSSQAAKGDEELDVPNLPAIPLPIKTLPTFNLVPSTPKQDKESALAKKETVQDKSAACFVFASPIALPAQTLSASNVVPEKNPSSGQQKLPAFATEKATETNTASSLPSKPSFVLAENTEDSARLQAEYKFSQPLSVVTPAKPSVTFKMPEPKTPITKRVSESSLESSPKTSTPDEKAFGGLQPAAELKTGSVMDILGKIAKKPSSDGNKDDTGGKATISTAPGTFAGFGDKFRPQQGSWECQVCLVRNGASSSKCVSCDEPKVKAQDTVKQSTSFANFGDKFKPLVGSWECSSCMLRNKPDVNKCAACEATKPNKQSVPAPAAEENASVLAAKSLPAISSPAIGAFKLSDSMWECETCLVRNNVSSGQCIACESPKPGAVSTSSSSANGAGTLKMTAKAPMPAAASTLFKFGFQPATTTASTEPSAKMQPPPPLTTTSTFGLSFGSADGFKFGAPATVPSHTFVKPDAPVEAAGFKFGAVKTVGKVGNPEVAVVPKDTVSVPKTSAGVKFTVTFEGVGKQEQSQQAMTFGTAAKPAVSASLPTETLFGSSSSMAFKDFQGGSSQMSVATNQSSGLTKAPGQFPFTSAPSMTEAPKQAPSLFTIADTKTTVGDTPQGGFKFTLGQKDVGEDFSATAAKRPAVTTSITPLPSYSAFTNTPLASTGVTTTTTSASTIGGFPFGLPPPASSSSSTSSSTPAPVFGSMASSSTKNPTAAFTFGSATPATTQTQNTAPSFSAPNFGALASSTSAPSSTPTPVFGQMMTSSSATFGSSAAVPSFTFGSTSTAPPGQNLFGGSQGTGNMGANLPAFGSGSNVSSLSFNSAVNPVPSFAAPTAGLLPSYKTAMGNTALGSSSAGGGGFNFGAAATPAPTFQFGAQQQQQQPQQLASVGAFSFGAAQAPQAQQSGNLFTFNAPAPAASTGGFNFNPSNPKVFNFSGTTEPPTFAANPGTTADNPKIRPFKKARRRTSHMGK